MAVPDLECILLYALLCSSDLRNHLSYQSVVIATFTAILIYVPCCKTEENWPCESTRKTSRQMSLEAAIMRVCVFQGFMPRFCTVKKWMSDELWLPCGMEATEAEIKGGRWLTHSGWVLAAVAAGECSGITVQPSSPLLRPTLIEFVISWDRQAKSLVEKRLELLVCCFAPDGRRVNVKAAWITGEHCRAEGESTPKADVDLCIVCAQWCNTTLNWTVQWWAVCNIRSSLGAIWCTFYAEHCGYGWTRLTGQQCSRGNIAVFCPAKTPLKKKKREMHGMYNINTQLSSLLYLRN